MATPNIQLIVADEAIPTSLQTALDRVGAKVYCSSLDSVLTGGVSAEADLCVIVPGNGSAQPQLDRIVDEASDHACATMVLKSPANGAWKAAPSPPTEIDVNDRLHPNEVERISVASIDELAGRIRALCEVRRPLQRMHAELARLRRQDEKLLSDAREMDEQLHLASQVQRDLLPDPLIDTSPIQTTTLFMPADFVSGDIYDIARLDEDCFGFSIADATGHGLPAALLTVFIKNLLRGKEITDTGYRIIEPDEVLMRLNSELLSTNLSQCQFVTALHAIFDRSNNTVRWARGGVPYPILLRPGQAPQLMRSHGGLTGALGDQRFEIASCRLAPGDTLLLFTDGIEALLMDDMIKSGNTASIIDTQWLQQVIHDGPAAALSALRDNALSLGPRDWAKDDITVLALRMN